MLRKYCHDTGRDWDEGVPFALFAIRGVKQESLGFSPAELVFGHDVRGRQKVLKEQFLCNISQQTTVQDLVSRCTERLRHASALAKVALSSSQESMKERFDRKAVERELMEFKNCVPERIVVYLNEKKVSTLRQAAILADEFALTHKSAFFRQESSTHRETALRFSDTRVPRAGTSFSSPKTDRQCFF